MLKVMLIPLEDAEEYYSKHENFTVKLPGSNNIQMYLAEVMDE